MRQVILFALAITLSTAVEAAGGAAAALSSRAPDELLETYQRYAQATLQHDIVPQLLSALPPVERRSLEAARFVAVFHRNPYRVGLVRSTGRRPVIEIGAAFVAALDVGSDARTVAAKAQRNRDLIGFAQRRQ